MIEPDVFPDAHWPAPSVSAQWSADALDEARAYSETIDTAAVMIVHRGRPVAQWGDVPARHSHGPGTWWCYNNWDFNALGTIFEQQTERGIFDEFRDRVAAPRNPHEERSHGRG